MVKNEVYVGGFLLKKEPPECGAVLQLLSRFCSGQNVSFPSGCTQNRSRTCRAVAKAHLLQLNKLTLLFRTFHSFSKSAKAALSAAFFLSLHQNRRFQIMA